MRVGSVEADMRVGSVEADVRVGSVEAGRPFWTCQIGARPFPPVRREVISFGGGISVDATGLRGSFISRGSSFPERNW